MVPSIGDGELSAYGPILKASLSAQPIDLFYENQFCAPSESAFFAFGSRSMLQGYKSLAEELEILINKLAME